MKNSIVSFEGRIYLRVVDVVEGLLMLSMIRKSRKSSSSFMCRFIYIVMLCLDPLFTASKYHYQIEWTHVACLDVHARRHTHFFSGENHTQILHVFNFKGTIENANMYISNGKLWILHASIQWHVVFSYSSLHLFVDLGVWLPPSRLGNCDSNSFKYVSIQIVDIFLHLCTDTDNTVCFMSPK